MENKQYQEIKELVIEKAKQYKEENGFISWAKIERILDEVYPEHELTRDGIRAIYRRNYDEPYMEIKTNTPTSPSTKKWTRHT